MEQVDVVQLQMRVAQLTKRVIDKDREFEQERGLWRTKERRYQREIRELKAGHRQVADAEF